MVGVLVTFSKNRILGNKSGPGNQIVEKNLNFVFDPENP